MGSSTDYKTFADGEGSKGRQEQTVGHLCSLLAHAVDRTHAQSWLQHGTEATPPVPDALGAVLGPCGAGRVT